MNALLQDIRFALRLLARNPGFTSVAIVCLALGIGASTAIYSVADAFLINPFPFDHSRYVFVHQRAPDWPRTWRNSCNAPWTHHWITNTQTLQALMPMQSWSLIVGNGQKPEELDAGVVPAKFFAFFEIPLLHGSEFTPEQQRPGSNHVVILGSDLWRRQFGGRPDIIGKQITLNFEPYTVVGVLDAELGNALPFPLFVPLDVDALAEGQPYSHYLMVFGKLEEGVTPQQAEQELTALAKPLFERWPAEKSWMATVTPFAQTLTENIAPLIILLSAAVSLLLLIGCANVANLLLSRSADRRHEMALRAAAGAGRGRLIRQLLTESVVLAVLAGGAGMLVAAWGVDLFIWLLRDSSGNDYARTQMLEQLRLDGWALAFCLGLSVGTGLVFGVLPAFGISHVNISQAVKEAGTRATEGGRGRRLRSALVVAEIALGLILLCGAAISARSFAKLSAVDLGIKAEGVFNARVTLPSTRYRTPADRARFGEELLPRLQAIPGAQAAGITQDFTFSTSNYATNYALDSADARPLEELPAVQYQQISPGYFDAVGMQLLAGTNLSADDSSTDKIVVNKAFADKCWPGKDPVGQRIYFLEDKQWKGYDVVGLVSNTRRSVQADWVREVYRSYRTGWFDDLHIVIRTWAGDPQALTSAVEKAVWAVDPDLAVSRIQELQSRVRTATAAPRAGTVLMGVLSGLALVLAATGVYSVMSHNVSRSRRDIAIRMALGAQSSQIVRRILLKGLALTAGGLAIGLAVTIALSRVVRELLYEVDPVEPLMLAGVSVFLAAVALLACLVPAWRAARVDPMTVLRCE